MATKKTNLRHSTRSILILAATLALLVSMTLVAYGTGLLSEVITVLTPLDNVGSVLNGIYGNTIPTDSPYMEDYQGNYIACPNMERITLDSQAAEEMIGAYVSAVDGTFAVDNNTFSLCTFMIDEMGMGAFTWTVENCNGIYYKNIGYGMVDFTPASPFSDPTLTLCSGNDRNLCDTFTYLIKEESNGTKLHLVTFFGTTAAFTAGDELSWQVKDCNIRIVPVNCMPTKKLGSENNMSVSVSHHGMILNAKSDIEIVPNKIMIHLTDGTMYSLKDKDTYNESGSLWRKDGKKNYDQLLVLFNRLINPEEILSVEVEYIWREAVEGDRVSESILHKERQVFRSDK